MFRASVALAAGLITAVSIGAAHASTPGNQAALNGVYRITWTTKQLRFHIVSNRGEAGDEVLFGAKNWKKIG